MMSKQINNMQDLLDYFYADTPRSLNRRIYKDTACGASISVLIAPEDPDEFGDLPSFQPPFWVHNGEGAWDYLTPACRLKAFTIQTIVEGSDATVDSLPFVLPVETAEVDKWIEDMEAQADELWREANNYDEFIENLREES
jgi:hypothetical protein